MGIRKFTKGILFGLAAFMGVMLMWQRAAQMASWATTYSFNKSLHFNRQ